MKKTTKTSRDKPPFDFHEALRVADDILSRPPVKAHTRRPADLFDCGLRVARFALPSELCLSSNETGRRGFAASRFKHTEVKDDLFAHMSAQYLHQWNHMVRFNLPISKSYWPRVHCIKFSPSPTDVAANWAKAPVDMLTTKKWVNKAALTMTKRRLGIVHDDRPDVIDAYHWWEFCSSTVTRAFVVIEVRCPVNPNNPNRKTR